MKKKTHEEVVAEIMAERAKNPRLRSWDDGLFNPGNLIVSTVECLGILIAAPLLLVAFLAIIAAAVAAVAFLWTTPVSSAGLVTLMIFVWFWVNGESRKRSKT